MTKKQAILAMLNGLIVRVVGSRMYRVYVTDTFIVHENKETRYFNVNDLSSLVQYEIVTPDKMLEENKDD